MSRMYIQWKWDRREQNRKVEKRYKKEEIFLGCYRLYIGRRSVNRKKSEKNVEYVIYRRKHMKKFLKKYRD